MKQNVRIVNRFRGYYHEDCQCKYCTNFRGNKRGCKLKECPFEEIRQEAILKGRIKRKRGANKWDD